MEPNSAIAGNWAYFGISNDPAEIMGIAPPAQIGNRSQCINNKGPMSVAK